MIPPTIEGMPIIVSPKLELAIRQGKAPPPPPFPMRLLIPHEAQALKNHDQSLQQLKARGGLGAAELLAIMEDRPWKEMVEDDAFGELGRIMDRAGLEILKGWQKQ